MAHPSEEAIQIGAHRFWVESDLSVVVVSGDVEADHVVSLQQANHRLFDRYGYTLTLVDARKAGTMTPGARRASALHQRQHSIPGAVGVFGIGLMVRALVALYTRTVSLFSTTQRETALFQTEDEARVWLDSQRLRLRTAVERSS